MKPIVIVIPYYKARFFRAVLESFAAQTCKDFSLFIGDDCSPESPVEVIGQFSAQLPITYHRFDSNLGRHSLVQHWNRCVRMTKEPWIWLFSDDDVVEPRCIELFLSELERAPVSDVYRFSKGIIDDAGRVSTERIDVPLTETAEEMILARFRDSRTTTFPEHVFARSAFERESGFVEFPLAWWSDDASCALLARNSGIRTIPGARVFWRNGSFNTSSKNRAVPMKVAAFESYLTWLRKVFPHSNQKVIELTREWIPMGFCWIGDSVPLKSIFSFWHFFSRYTGRWELGLLFRMLKWNSSIANFLRSVRMKWIRNRLIRSSGRAEGVN